MLRPLEGIRALEWGAFHAGPGGAAILADLGAEVIKIEQPGTGDTMRSLRRIGRYFLEAAGGRNAFFDAANRGKKSITIDLSHPKGKEIVYRLVARSDVFLTNLRQSTVEQMGLTYPVLSQHNPRLIYARVSGYGPRGPDRDLGGFDPQAQARSGMMYAMGEPDMPPLLIQFGVVDQATAIMASHEIITALLMRERFGIGQEVHVSVLSTAIYLLYMNLVLLGLTGQEPGRHHRPTAEPLRNFYCCADGRWLILTLTPPEKYWKPLCQCLGRPELEMDPRFDNEETRLQNAAELVGIMDAIFATRPRDEWVRILQGRGIICCAVNTLRDLASDPQILENNYLVDFEDPSLGRVKIPGFPIHFSKAWAGTTSLGPELGAHTEEVLKEVAGYSPPEIRQMKKEGVL